MRAFNGPLSLAELPSWGVGLGLALCGYTLCGMGMNLIKLSHLRSPTARVPPARETRFNRRNLGAARARALWLGGYAVNCTGGLLNTLGLRFAAQSLLAPMSSIALVSNAVFATLLLGERLSFASDALPMVLIPFGNILAIAAANHSNPRALSVNEILALFRRPMFVAYAITSLSLASFLMLLRLHLTRLIRRSGGPEHASPTLVSYCGLSHVGSAALLCVNSVFMSKALLLTLANGFHNVFKLQFVALLCCYATLALFWMFNLSNLLRAYDALFVVPAIETLWCVGSLVSGGIFFDEYSALSRLRKMQFLMGVCTSFTGVYFLSRRAERTRATQKLG